MLENFNASLIMQLTKTAEEFKEPSNLQVVAMGIGTVFLGLICIVILCMIVGAICNAGKKNSDEATAPAVVAAPVQAPAVIENRQEIIAAVSAVAAEELGTDVSAIRIVSFKKI